MKKVCNPFVFITYFLLVTAGFAKYTAEISYVTVKGRAHLLANPDMTLSSGHELMSTDVVILENGAGARILFLELQMSERYQAPDTISIAEEIRRLKLKPVPSNKTEKAIVEMGRFVSQYFKPTYNCYAGTRSISVVTGTMVHDHMRTFRQQPDMIIRGVNQDQELSISDTSGNKLFEVSVRIGRGIIAVPVENIKLEFDRTYKWTVSSTEQMGEIKLISEKEAVEVEKTIQAMTVSALDSAEAAQSIAIYLFDQGFWAEAYVYAQKGLEFDSDNKVLNNLQQAILNLRPEDSEFQETALAGGELSLRYSFHIQKGNRLQEIYDGTKIHSGDKLVIRCEASDDCYLFILNFDAANKLYVLYPLENHDHFLRSKEELVLPGAGKFYQADNQIGKEKLFLVAAKIPLDFLACDLDRYIRASQSDANDNSAMRGLIKIRGFSQVVDEQGEPTRSISEGMQSFELSRLLKGKGLIIKEIVFNHVK